MSKKVYSNLKPLQDNIRDLCSEYPSLQVKSVDVICRAAMHLRITGRKDCQIYNAAKKFLRKADFDGDLSVADTSENLLREEMEEYLH